MCAVTYANYRRPHSPDLKSTNNVQRKLADQSERQIIDHLAHGKLQALKRLAASDGHKPSCDISRSCQDEQLVQVC